jgi:antitoxin ParD1/3/4
MDVTLPSEFDELIRRRVESGRYGSAPEVVSDALRLLEERDRLRAGQMAELRRKVRVGLDQLDRGESAPLDLDGIWAEVEAGLATEREAG